MKLRVHVNLDMEYWQFFSPPLPWQAAENRPALLSMFCKKREREREREHTFMEH